MWEGGARQELIILVEIALSYYFRFVRVPAFVHAPFLDYTGNIYDGYVVVPWFYRRVKKLI